MMILVRVALCLVVLCLLAGLAGMLSLFTPIPWLSGFTTGLIQSNGWLPTAFSIVLLFFAAASVLALVMIVTVKRKHGQYILHRDSGDIEISRQSIESEANGALEGIHDIKRYHVQAKGDLRPGRLKLDVQAEPRDNRTSLADLGAGIQKRLADVLSQSLAIEPEHVRVHLHAVQPTPEGHRRHDKVPRVV